MDAQVVQNIGVFVHTDKCVCMSVCTGVLCVWFSMSECTCVGCVCMYVCV